MSYMVPVGRGVQQEYQDPLHDFTCCCGTGMESHGLHGYGIYYESNDTLWVNLFVPSSAQFAMAGASLQMETGFPDGDSAKMTLTLKAPREFTLAVRRPVWAGDGFAIKVNGVAALPSRRLRRSGVGEAGRARSNAFGNESGVATRQFVRAAQASSGSPVIRSSLALPKTVRLASTPDNKQVAAFLWGPLVLAGDWGPRREGRAAVPPVPVLVAGGRPVGDWRLAAELRAGDFVASQVARLPGQAAAPVDVQLTPFYRTHRRRYSVYFDVLTPAEFEERKGRPASL